MEGERETWVGRGTSPRELSLGAVGLHCRIRPFVPRSEVDRVRVDRWFTAEGPKANNQQVILY